MCAECTTPIAEAPERVRQQRDQTKRDVSVEDGEAVREKRRGCKKHATVTRERRNVKKQNDEIREENIERN